MTEQTINTTVTVLSHKSKVFLEQLSNTQCSSSLCRRCVFGITNGDGLICFKTYVKAVLEKDKVWDKFFSQWE